MEPPKKELPTILTKEIKAKIAELLESGLSPDTDKQEIADALEIPLDTLKELFIKERQERLLRKAEFTSEQLLDINLDDPHLHLKYSKEKINLMKLIRAEAEFIRETIGKDMGYSKRNEITGKNGEEIRIREIIFNPPVIAKPNAEAH